MEEKSNIKYRRGDRSIFFPVLIIFVGVILLLANLNVIPGNGWNLIVKFWPIIFILGGIDDLLNRKWTGAVINFGIGSILILANFGFFAMTTWQIIVNFWPIIIIAIGLEIIFRGRTLLSSIIGVGFAILVVAGLFWFLFQSPSTKGVETDSVNYELTNVDLVELYLEPLVGSLMIDSGSSSNQIISGQINSSNNDDINFDSSVVDRVQKISITSEGNVIYPTSNMYNSYSWDIALNSDVPFDLQIQQIVGSQTINLDELEIKGLDSKLVIGAVEITLPEIEKLNANLECIIGELVIIVPDNVEVAFNIDTGITGVSFDDNFDREGDLIFTKNSKNNQDYVVNVNIPIGSLSIINP